jgi:hypothetical protein
MRLVIKSIISSNYLSFIPPVSVEKFSKFILIANYEMKLMFGNLLGPVKHASTTRHNNNNKRRMDGRELFTNFVLKFSSLIISTLNCLFVPLVVTDLIVGKQLNIHLHTKFRMP